MSFALSGADRSAVQEALEEIRATPVPPDRSPLGCVVALPGLLLLLTFPVVGRLLGAGPTVAKIVLVAGTAALVVGLVLWFMAGGAGRRHAEAAAEAALRHLEGDDEDRESALRAAVLLLTNAFAMQGASMAASVDFAKARRRLGDRLPLVLAVEALLLEEEAIYPVFSAATEGDTGGDEG
jgi:hypothetical protein